MAVRIAVDTGGTFTDVALFNDVDGVVHVTKVLSTPDNPARAVLEGVHKILAEQHVQEDNVHFFIHGTTVATNALLERKGARTALLTTKGFRDVLHIGRQNRPKLYDFRARKAAPLVPRHLRFEVDERVRANGSIVKSVDARQIKQIAARLREEQVEAIAVCLLHAYVNDDHEQRIAALLKQELGDIPITLSSDVLPEIREYERTSTTVCNAYVQPVMSRYLGNLQSALARIGIASDLFVMQSNGGIITADEAIAVSARTALSGPAGGAVSGTLIAKQTGRPQLITIDMGGTSLDTCLIHNGQAQFSMLNEIGGLPIKLPMIDMHTIGSGGGSIAWIDRGGALQVGPESAGANPGPVCYGKGGTEPTVTDANVVLGRISPQYLLGGEMNIDVQRAKEAIQKKIATPLGMSVEEAAEGILRVVNANMVRGIRVISVEKGHDPRSFSLVAFGGAGPVHALDLAEEIGCSEVIVPPHPGITSAFGMLAADVRHDYVQSIVSTLPQLKIDPFNHMMQQMKQEAVQTLRRERFADADMSIQYSVDMRYANQSYELTVPILSYPLHETQKDELAQRFHNEHENMYGYKRLDTTVEIVNVRLSAIGHIAKEDQKRECASNAKMSDPMDYREVYMHGAYERTPIYKREDLIPGTTFEGPAVIEQLDSTVLVYSGQKMSLDAYGNIIIQRNVEDETGKNESQGGTRR